MRFLIASIIWIPLNFLSFSLYVSLYCLMIVTQAPYSACLNEVNILGEFLSCFISEIPQGLFTCHTSLSLRSLVTSGYGSLLWASLIITSCCL